ncbi:MAG: FAD-binding protein [Alphaproteobacteria bacterium]|nr:FAD-binding protein [Alphaproteobacteria bacterium]
MAVLLLAEVSNGLLDEATARALTAAKALNEPVHILVTGDTVETAGEAAAKLNGAAKVLLADDPLYTHGLAEPLAALIVQLAVDYSAILAAATTFGKNVLPRVAALLDVMQISEIIKVKAPDVFERPIYAGNATLTVQSTDTRKVITVRAASFQPAGTGPRAPVEKIAPAAVPELSRFKEETIAKSERPELGAAKIVISGGRGLQSEENFKTLIEPIATALGAAIGASRAAVDAGFAPNNWQVGQTGKIVAPDLYIAVGISGAIQHLAGMKDAKIIVAINKDEDAPIFQVADYGLVGDLFNILPELNEALAKLGHKAK